MYVAPSAIFIPQQGKRLQCECKSSSCASWLWGCLLQAKGYRGIDRRSVQAHSQDFGLKRGPFTKVRHYCILCNARSFLGRMGTAPFVPPWLRAWVELQGFQRLLGGSELQCRLPIAGSRSAVTLMLLRAQGSRRPQAPLQDCGMLQIRFGISDGAILGHSSSRAEEGCVFLW